MDLLAAMTRMGSCSTYLRIQEQINRIEGLKPYEYDTLLFILDRTVRFGKIAERISIDQVQKGLYKKDTGELLRRGVGQNRNNTVATLRTLVQKGYLSRTDTGATTAPIYGLSAQLFVFAGIVEVSDGILHEVSDAILQRSISCDTLKDKQILKGKRNQKERPPGGKATVVVSSETLEKREEGMQIAEAIAQAKMVNRAKRETKANSLATKFTLQNLNALWASLLLEHFPETRLPGRFTTNDFHKLKASLKAQQLLDNPEDAIELIRYSVENWTYLYEYCGWSSIRMFQTQPSVQAMVSGIKILLEARNRRESAVKHYSSATAVTRLRVKQERESLRPVRKPTNTDQYDSPDPEGDQEDDDRFFAKRFHRDLMAAI